MSDLRIVRILRVRDTREFEEQSRNGRDVMVPIPGTGDARECDRCGRLHEIHATVELESGAEAVVGTGCMGAENLELVRALKSGARSATTRARNRALARRLIADIRFAEEAVTVALRTPMPPVSDEPNEWSGREQVVARGSVDFPGGSAPVETFAAVGEGWNAREKALEDLASFWRWEVAREWKRAQKPKLAWRAPGDLRMELRAVLKRR